MANPNRTEQEGHSGQGIDRRGFLKKLPAVAAGGAVWISRDGFPNNPESSSREIPVLIIERGDHSMEPAPKTLIVTTDYDLDRIYDESLGKNSPQDLRRKIIDNIVMFSFGGTFPHSGFFVVTEGASKANSVARVEREIYKPRKDDYYAMSDISASSIINPYEVALIPRKDIEGLAILPLWKETVGEEIYHTDQSNCAEAEGGFIRNQKELEEFRTKKLKPGTNLKLQINPETEIFIWMAPGEKNSLGYKQRPEKITKQFPQGFEVYPRLLEPKGLAGQRISYPLTLYRTTKLNGTGRFV